MLLREIDIPDVIVKVVEDNLSEEALRASDINYLLNQALTKKPKLLANIQREA